MALRGYLFIWILVKTKDCDGTIPDFYYSDGVRKTWDDAKTDCGNRGMELATLDTADKHEAAKTYINSHSSTRDVFIGLSLDRSGSYPPYVYIYTNGIVPTYLPWGHPEPNDQSFHFCIRMHRSYDFGYFTISCTSTSYDYLCTSPIESQTTQVTETTTATTAEQLITTLSETTEYVVESTTQTDTTVKAEQTTQHATTTVSETTPHVTTTVSETTQQATTTVSETTQHATTTVPETTQHATTTVSETTPYATTTVSETTRHATTTVSTQYGGETTKDLHTTTQDKNCLCPCSGYINQWLHLQNSNLTYNEIKAIMKYELYKMRKGLLIDKKETSKYIRSITSAKDDRKSSFRFGIIGIVFLSIIAGGAIFADCTRLVSSCR